MGKMKKIITHVLFAYIVGRFLADRYAGPALLEFHLHAQFNGTVAIEQGREEQQLANGCKDGAVNDSHRWDKEAAYYQPHRHKKAYHER